MDQLTFERAGWLYGLILNRLPAGDLTMRYAKRVRAFAFRWDFRSQGHIKGREHLISECELSNAIYDMNVPADYIVELLTHEAGVIDE